MREDAHVPGPARRYGLLILPFVACVLLVIGEFSNLYEIHVITVTVKTVTGGSHHGYALLVVALAAAAMAFGAVIGRSRPAAYALVVLGVVALVVVLAIDLPNIDDTGLYGRDYEQARAKAGTGFKLETAGAILLLLGAVSILIFGPRPERAPRRPRAEARARASTRG
jgi:uncharacterized membrane protein YtjA (UPF0391 family)